MLEAAAVSFTAAARGAWRRRRISAAIRAAAAATEERHLEVEVETALPWGGRARRGARRGARRERGHHARLNAVKQRWQRACHLGRHRAAAASTERGRAQQRTHKSGHAVRPAAVLVAVRLLRGTALRLICVVRIGDECWR